MSAKRANELTHNNITTRIVEVDVAQARKWLASISKNRPTRILKIKKYAADLTEGRWKLNGEPIIVSDSGKLLDGQHRCHAIIASDRPMLTLVTYGIPEDVFDTVDTGVNRTPGDILSIEGCAIEGVKKAARTMAAMIRWVVVIEHRYVSIGNFSNVGNDIIRQRFVKDQKDLIASLVKANDCQSDLMHISQAAALHYALSEKDTDDADRFIEDLASGAHLKSSDPVLVLRNQFIKNMTRPLSKRMSQIDKLAMAIKAWNYRRSCMTFGERYELD